jgi:hypothetical protein
VKLRPAAPKSRAQLRAFWFPVIRHHTEANISVADKYGRTFPSWLEAEVDRLTPHRWLAYWDQTTGRPKSR